MKKSKIKSIQEMWNLMQELNTKRELTTVESLALQVCTNFFVCSNDFIDLFDNCIDTLASGTEVTAITSDVSAPPRNPPKGYDKDEETLAMMTNMYTTPITPVPPVLFEPVHISPELEASQMSEFHQMMAHLDEK